MNAPLSPTALINPCDVTRAMELQPGWPDFLLVAPASTDRPGGLVHMLELKRWGEDLNEVQDALSWCTGQGDARQHAQSSTADPVGNPALR